MLNMKTKKQYRYFTVKCNIQIECLCIVGKISTIYIKYLFYKMLHCHSTKYQLKPVPFYK